MNADREKEMAEKGMEVTVKDEGGSMREHEKWREQVSWTQSSSNCLKEPGTGVSWETVMWV